MTKYIVVAASENNVIGKNNQLLWKLPNDMAFFKNVTWGLPVIMGRKTFESFGGKPLKGRTNIVISRSGNIPGAEVVVSSLNDAVREAEKTDSKECCIIGGGEIYKQAMHITDVIYLTRVHATFEGDTWFPAIDENKWALVDSISCEADEKHAYAYTFETWKRK